ncbi:MAG TPA: glycosyltransferase family 2 protein [Solirubrobacteraceae bacterium]|nr:glycosyltransferase family 2 protein [Solirubrobacteraceae bacterium]
MSPAVSLVMPAWRPRPDWLRAAVASALDERACEIELIVVDDGSDEPVAELLRDVDDPRLRVIRVGHGGPYAARNAGIAAAAGEFLRFVDADDIVESGSTGRLLERARQDPGALVYGATLMCDVDLTPQRTVTSDSEGWVEEQCVLGGFDVYLVSILFPRAVVERAGPWEETRFAVSGDWDFVLRAIEQAPVRRLDEVVTRYRRHEASVTKTADVAAGGAAARLVLGRYFERHPERRGGDLERRAYLRVHLDRARAHAWFGERRLAARELAAAARLGPLAAARTAAGWGADELRALRDRVRGARSR